MSHNQLAHINKMAGVLLSVILVVVAVGCQGGGGGGVGKTFYVSKTGNDNNDCLSQSKACLTIQAAIDKAGSGDSVRVGQGLFQENIVIGYKKSPDSQVSLTLIGAGMHDTVISGVYGSFDSTVFLNCFTCYLTVAISDLSITKGEGVEKR